MTESKSAREIPVQGGMPPTVVRGLAEFIKTHYVDARKYPFFDRSYTETWSRDGSSVEMEWLSGGPGTSSPTPTIATHLAIGFNSVSVAFPGLDSSNALTNQASQRVADDIEMLVTSFLGRAKTTSLYFIFSTGLPGVHNPVAPQQSAGGEALRRIMSGNTMNLYLLIMAASFGLFFLLGTSAIFAVLAIQLVALFYSDRLALMVGKVRPTAERPNVTIVCVPVSPDTKQLIEKYAKSLVPEITERLEKSVSENALEGAPAIQAVQEALAKSGIKSPPEEITIVTRNVYRLVKGVADRFKLSVPKIAIMNNVTDNAAATGVSPSRAAVTITAGSLEDLGDAELSSVLGHELGHIKGHDSLILFSVTFLLYVGGLYLWLPLLLYLGIFYYIAIFAIIFAVGKVLETRADTESVATLGEPGVMASALTKIGFRQLYYEKYSPGVRFFDWLRFDPHPPIYFRVQRLSKFATGSHRMGNTFLISLRDCVTGFIRTLV